MTPITRQEAELAYDRIRTYLIFSACWFLLVAAVVVITGMNGWEISLGAILVIEVVAAALPSLLPPRPRAAGSRRRECAGRDRPDADVA